MDSEAFSSKTKGKCSPLKYVLKRKWDVQTTALMASYHDVCFHCWEQIITEAISNHEAEGCLSLMSIQQGLQGMDLGPALIPGHLITYSCMQSHTTIGVTREKDSGDASGTLLYFWHPSGIHSKGLTRNGQVELEPQESKSSCSREKTSICVSLRLCENTSRCHEREEGKAGQYRNVVRQGSFHLSPSTLLPTQQVTNLLLYTI